MSPARQPSRQQPLRQPVDDFDANELVKEHVRSIEGLRAELDDLVDRFGDDDKFGHTFEAAALKDKRIDGAVSAILVQLIVSNPDVRDAIGSAVNAADREWQKVVGKRLTLALWSVALIVIGAVVDHFVLR